MKTPRPYQEEAIRWSNGKDGLYLAMQMRLGKSLVAHRILQHRKHLPALILAPRTTLISWEEELTEEGLSFVNLAKGSIKKRLKALQGNLPQFVLLNYETMRNKEVRKFLDNTKDFPFQALICDEATKLKSPKTQAVKTLMRICDRFKTVISLSGLPTPQSWFDLWSQMAILNQGRWMGCGNYWKWLSKISEPSEFGYGREITSSGEKAIKEAYHAQAYILSRKDAGLGETKIYQKRSGVLDSDSRRIYETIKKDWEIPGLALAGGGGSQAKFAMVLVSWMRRLCGGHLPNQRTESWKYDCLSDLLKTDLNDSRAVVWFAFNDEIKRAKEHLDVKTRYRVRTLSGDCGDEARRIAIDAFRKDPKGVLFVQLKLGQYGLNLSAADTAIYFSNSYSLEERAQSEDRIVMPNKGRPLLYIDFVTEDTVEEDIIHDLRDKKFDAMRLLKKNLGFGGPRPGRDRVGSLEGKPASVVRKLKFVIRPMAGSGERNLRGSGTELF